MDDAKIQKCLHIINNIKGNQMAIPGQVDMLRALIEQERDSKSEPKPLKLEAGCRVKTNAGNTGTVFAIGGKNAWLLDANEYTTCTHWTCSINTLTVIEAATPEVNDTVRHADGEIGIISRILIDNEDWVDIKFAGDSKHGFWRCSHSDFTILHKAPKNT